MKPRLYSIKESVSEVLISSGVYMWCGVILISNGVAALLSMLYKTKLFTCCLQPMHYSA